MIRAFLSRILPGHARRAEERALDLADKEAAARLDASARTHAHVQRAKRESGWNMTQAQARALGGCVFPSYLAEARARRGLI